MDIRTSAGENRILKSLPAADLAEMQPFLKEVTLVQGVFLSHPGVTIEHVYFPTSGVVSLLAVMKSGQQIETGIVGRSGVVGASTANAGALSFGQATVQIQGVALQLPRFKFLAMVEKSSTLRRLANEFEAYLYFQAQQSAACYAVHSVEARLCRWMLQCQDATNSDVIPLTQEFLSQMMGVQRNAVSLCAHELQNAGLIEYSRGTINILDRERLESCACECYAAISNFGGKMIPPLDSHGARPVSPRQKTA
jgi:CRP-like cAMP-binding protein